MTHIPAEELLVLKETAAKFMKNEYAREPLYLIEEKALAYSEDLWRKLAELGWTGVLIPEEYGGWGGGEDGYQLLLILLEEMGRHLYVGPYFSTMLGALSLLKYGTTEQKQTILPGVAAGTTRMTFAWYEPLSDCADDIAAFAVETGTGYELTGTKVLVENAHVSDFCICPVRTIEGSAGWQGVTLFLVDLKSAGVVVEEIPTLGLEKECAVTLRQVKVGRDQVVGELHGAGAALGDLIAAASLARGQELSGALAAALDMTVQYSQERSQYGKAIGANQVIQHYLANIWMDLVKSRQILSRAASMTDPASRRSLCAMAKAWVGQAAVRSTERCVQIHGAIGTTKEHNISYYYKQAMAWDLSVRSSQWHLNRVSQLLKDGALEGLMD
jgi:alkylation response protein AidB-like acyl-CoA dehydrogenase